MSDTPDIESEDYSEGIGAKKLTFNALRNRMVSVEKSVRAVNKRLNSIEPAKIESALAILHERAEALAARYQVLLLRDCVWSEVAMSCEGEARLAVVNGILDCCGESDSWWQERGDMTIKDWRELLTARGTRPELTVIKGGKG